MTLSMIPYVIHFIKCASVFIGADSINICWLGTFQNRLVYVLEKLMQDFFMSTTPKLFILILLLLKSFREPDWHKTT